MAYQVGQRIGDYEIVRILGAGGMGEVYQVRNVISDRVEAMKVLLPNLEGNSDLADRFLREIQVQATLSHPNIAGLHTAIRQDGKLLMLIEFVDGVSLEQRIRNGRVTPAQGVDYISQVLSALSFAHAKGVVHRDIKPANIMLRNDGVVKLMDFGIARMKENRKLTQTGQTVGSLYYMSPEQIRGEDLDGRSDLYSLGISLYELVTGKRPYDGTSDFAIMSAHLQQAPQPPIALDPSLPERLNQVILMAIAKDPAQRFQTAEAFRNALNNALPAEEKTKPLPHGPLLTATVPAAAAPPSTQAPPPPPAAPSRRGLYMALGSATTIVVLGLAIVQGPRWFSAGASPAQQSDPPVIEQTTANPPAPEPVPDPAPTPVEPQAGGSSVAQPQPRPTPELVRQNLPDSSPARPSVSQQLPPTPRPNEPRPEPPKQAQVEIPTPSPAPAPQAQTQQPAPAPAPPQPAPAADTRALDELQDRMMKLGIRIGAVQDKARSIAQQQAAQGVGMRSDVKAAQTLAAYLMDQAEKRIQAQDVQGAKTNLDRAERQVETLERILGL